MPSTKAAEEAKVTPAESTAAELKEKVAKAFNERYAKLNEAARNATNVWDRLEMEHRIKEVTDLYKVITELN